MTLEEICSKYKRNPKTFSTHFPRESEMILKKYGVKIIKEGRGAAATYREEIQDDRRALTVYQETKDEIFVRAELMNWDFLVFLAIATTPMIVFRGSYKDFLKYIEVKTTEENENHLKEALAALVEKDLIMFSIDKTDDRYFVASIYRKVEEEMQIGIDMVRKCKQIQTKYKKKSWVPLLKTWMAIEMAEKDGLDPVTNSELGSYVGLSDYQIRESKRLLENEFIIKSEKEYYLNKDNKLRCGGSSIEFNAFIPS